MVAQVDIVRVDRLPPGALEAAEVFRGEYLPAIRAHLQSGRSLTVALPSATHDHTDWRRAMARDLARAYAPARINFIAGGNIAAIRDAENYLAGADGVTGQYLPLAGNGGAG